MGRLLVRGLWCGRSRLVAARALLRCAFPWYAGVSPRRLAGSDCEGRVVEGDAEPVGARVWGAVS